MKKELQVAAVKDGTVIDHIPTEKLFDVVNLLELANLRDEITIGNNFASKRMGSKGIIKITGKFFNPEEVNRIAVVAQGIVLNVIHDYEVCEKRTITLPDELKNIVRCANPKCISNNEPMQSRFHVIDKKTGLIRCVYCEKTMTLSQVKLK